MVFPNPLANSLINHPLKNRRKKIKSIKAMDQNAGENLGCYILFTIIEIMLFLSKLFQIINSMFFIMFFYHVFYHVMHCIIFALFI